MTIVNLTQHDPTYEIAVSRFALTSKIPYDDPFWPKFNASFTNEKLTSIELIGAVYEGRPFTTCHKNHWRDRKNYICGQHLAVDMDTEDERSSLAYLVKDSFVKRYGAFLYTTPSHRPEKPRARVVFLLDTPIMQAKNYALAATALLWVFGTADRQCKDAARFFYGSKGCDVEILDNVLPVATVRDLIAKYEETGRIEKRRHERQYQNTTPELQEIEQVLDRINPWGIDYGDWVRILMALQAEYGDSALPLAEHWGEGDGDEIRRKWRSFKERGNDAGRVGLGTVYDIAKRFGWEYRKVA